MRHRPLPLLIGLLVLLSGFPAALAAQEPPAPSGDAAWRVTDSQPLAIDGEGIALSPDGQWLAGTNADHVFCVWDIATLTPRCDGERLPIRAETVRWSPDSTAVAFALDALRWAEESDIHVFEVESGTLANLTDDGVEGSLIRALAEDPPIDDTPAWSPDSQQIAFARSYTGEDDDPGSSTIMAIPRGGGAPVVLHEAIDEPLAVWMPMHWLPDGSLLYTQFAQSSLADPANGVWRLAPDGSAALVLPGSEEADLPAPSLAAVAADAGVAVVSSPLLLGQRAPTGQPAFATLDLATWETTPLGGVAPEPRVVAAGLAPDGSAVLAWTVDADGFAAQLIDPASGATTALDIDAIPQPPEPPAPQWAANDTALLLTVDGPLLLTLERAGPGATPAASPAATPVAAGGWTIAAEEEVAIPSRFAALSPDGQWLAGLGPDRALCIWDVATLSPACVAETLPIREETITWAPDSSAVAFALDAFRQFHDSDIYLLERETGALVNLTDDGFDGNAIEAANAGAPIDDVPAWSPDSQRLAFVRSTGTSQAGSTTIMAIDRAGGEPVEMLPLDTDEPFAVWTPMRWLPDGTLLYAQLGRDPADPGNGIWKIGVDDLSSPLQIAPGTEASDIPGAAISDAVGGTAIVYASARMRDFGFGGDAPLYWLLDVATGERQPIAVPGTGGAEAPWVLAAGLSPDGATALLVTRSPEGSRLMTLDLATGAIAPLDTAPREDAFYEHAPQWVDGDTVVLQRPNGPLLLTLERAE